MTLQYVARVLDRASANVGALRMALEAFLLAAVVLVGIFYFVSYQSYRERLALFSDKMASNQAMLSEYRAKLKGATPAEAATQIERLTTLLAASQKDLSEMQNKSTSSDGRPRDPHRLYADNAPIAVVQDPTVDLDRKTITFPTATSDIILGINQSYEFQNWRLACGGTRLYNSIRDATARAFSYSPLTCKIVGSR